jgi:hypothetical protein
VGGREGPLIVLRLCASCGLMAPEGSTVCGQCGRSLLAADLLAEAARDLPADVAEAARHPDNCFGPYVRVRPLGTGGSGEVWQGWHRGLRRAVAIKILSAAADGEGRDRFLREGATVAALRHPRIVTVYDAGVATIGGMERLYLAMDFLAGGTFDRDARPLRDRIAVLADVADALHHAHQEGVVHRDVKPANILLDASGRGHLADFGIARSEDASVRTATGMVVGTPGYMSPEQATGRRADARADVYGLGVILYEVLARRRPHEASTTMEMISKIVNEIPRPPRAINADADRELEAVCLRAMAKDPSGRFATAAALAEELRRWLSGERVRASAPSALAWMLRRRWKRAVALVALAAAVTVALAVSPRRRGTPPVEWIPVYDESMERAAAQPAWRTLRGMLAVHDGALCSRNAHAVLDLELGESVRIEYTAAVQGDALEARELSCFVSGTADRGLGEGYAFEIGIGAFHGIQRLHELSWKVAAPAVEKGRAYRVAAARHGASLSLTLDGALLLAVSDGEPLRGETRSRAGIGSTCSHLHYDELRVMVPRAEAAHVAQALASRKDHRWSAGIYGALRLGVERARQLALAGDVEEAEREMTELSGSSTDEGEIAAAAEVLVEISASRKRWTEALERVKGARARIAQPAAARRLQAALERLVERMGEELEPEDLLAALASAEPGWTRVDDLRLLEAEPAIAAGRFDQAEAALSTITEERGVSLLYELAAATAKKSILEAARARRAGLDASQRTKLAEWEAVIAARELAALAAMGEDVRARLSAADAATAAIPVERRIEARLLLAATAMAQREPDVARELGLKIGAEIAQAETATAMAWRGEPTRASMRRRRAAEFLCGLRLLSEGKDGAARICFDRYLGQTGYLEFARGVRAWMGR